MLDYQWRFDIPIGEDNEELYELISISHKICSWFWRWVNLFLMEDKIRCIICNSRTNVICNIYFHKFNHIRRSGSTSGNGLVPSKVVLFSFQGIVYTQNINPQIVFELYPFEITATYGLTIQIVVCSLFPVALLLENVWCDCVVIHVKLESHEGWKIVITCDHHLFPTLC